MHPHKQQKTVADKLHGGRTKHKHQLAAVIRPHPTFGEAVTEAIEDLDGLSIHAAKKKKR